MQLQRLAFMVVSIVGLPALGQKPAFEMVSIKQCVGPQAPASLSFSPGRLHIPCAGLMRLIQEAYQIYGDGNAYFSLQTPHVTPIESFRCAFVRQVYDRCEDGISTEHGDDARADDATRAGRAVWFEDPAGGTRVTVYIMTVAREGSKLRPSREESCDAGASRGGTNERQSPTWLPRKKSVKFGIVLFSTSGRKWIAKIYVYYT